MNYNNILNPIKTIYEKLKNGSENEQELINLGKLSARLLGYTIENENQIKDGESHTYDLTGIKNNAKDWAKSVLEKSYNPIESGLINSILDISKKPIEAILSSTSSLKELYGTPPDYISKALSYKEKLEGILKGDEKTIENTVNEFSEYIIKLATKNLKNKYKDVKNKSEQKIEEDTAEYKKLKTKLFEFIKEHSFELKNALTSYIPIKATTECDKKKIINYISNAIKTKLQDAKDILDKYNFIFKIAEKLGNNPNLTTIEED